MENFANWAAQIDTTGIKGHPWHHFIQSAEGNKLYNMIIKNDILFQLFLLITFHCSKF